MTDETPVHDTPSDPGATPAAPTAPAAAPSDPVARRRWWNRAGADRWQGRRGPLLVSVLALLLGCVIGGAVVAVGAFAGDGHHGDRRGHSRDEYAGGRGDDDHRRDGRTRPDRRDDDRDDRGTTPSAPASTAPASTAPAAPATTAPASGVPTPTASS